MKNYSNLSRLIEVLLNLFLCSSFKKISLLFFLVFFIFVFSPVFSEKTLIGKKDNSVFLSDASAEIDEKKKFTYTIGPLLSNLKKMEKDGVIISYHLAFFISKIFFLEKNVKKGIYSFSHSAGMLEVFWRLVKGKEDVYKITIYEGYDVYDIDEALFMRRIIRNRYDFVDYIEKPKTKAWIMKNAGLSNAKKFFSSSKVEGFFYPNTYHVQASNAVRQLIDLASREFRLRIVSFLQQEKVSMKKWQYILTAASLVEKETSLDQEKGLIASVLFNRLKKNMKLAFDPTLIYMLKVSRIYHQNFRNGNIDIKKRHFGMPSKYNTYYRKGLPPSPIATPTLSSVKVILHPTLSPYFFFVAKAKGNVKLGHDFSVTYKEHLEKIKRYQ